MTKKIALVGCGRISNRHVEAISSCPELELAVLCDTDIQKARHLAEQYHLPCALTDDLKSIADVDMAAILTPSGLHPRHVCEIASNTDIPCIICEKPVSLTLREAHEMMNCVQQHGKRLLPVYQNRYNPLIVLVRELIQSGKLGAIYQFVCNVLWNRNEAYFQDSWHGTLELDGGVLYTQASHYVDMVHFLFGEVVEHKGIGGNLRGFEVFDSLSATMRFRSGVVGAINATVSVHRTNYQTELTLIAQKGTIRLSGTNLNKVEFWDVDGVESPQMNFQISDVYGKGHYKLYEYAAAERWDMFPSKEDVLSGIRLMEMLSY